LNERRKKQSTQLKHKGQSKLSKLHKTNLFSRTHPIHGLQQSSISTNDIERHHFLALMQQHNDVQHSFPNHSREKDSMLMLSKVLTKLSNVAFPKP
jgi:hypothetical protein